MGNDVYIQSCIFTDVNKKGETLGKSYGFRIFDDEGRDYCNNLAKEVWDEMRAEGPDVILKHFIEFGYDGQAVAEFAMESKSSVYFDGEWTPISGYQDLEEIEVITKKDEEEIE